MEERNELIEWIKENKKELVAAGVCIGALLLIVLDIKSKVAVTAILDLLNKVLKRPPVKAAETVVKVTSEVPREPLCETVVLMTSDSGTLPFWVRRHLRNLPNGKHASPEKIAAALKESIILMDGQTWVESYMKGGAVA